MGGGTSVEKTPRQPVIKPQPITKPQPTQPPQTQQPQQQRSQPPQEAKLQWPLPKKEQERIFRPNEFIDNERYKLSKSRFDRNATRGSRSTGITSIRFPYAENEDRDTSNHVESNLYNSAHVQMTMQTQTTLWAGMSTTEEMRNLLDRINRTHIESNEIIQQRLEALSNEADRVHGMIMEETTEEQNRLVAYAQELQRRYEELQREWLQKYVIELDRWRAEELTNLHEKLEHSKNKIDTVLQRKLDLNSKQVENAKSEIFDDEKRRQKRKADKIMAEVERLSRENRIQHIGTEAETDMYVKIRANAGNI